MVIQPIVDIAEICSRKGMVDVIASPGSRCAPLTLAFARHPDISVRSISDERTAAFTALGMAQRDKHVVGLVCTSGSAVYNYAPAVAEAFFQQIPLLIFTADRPPEWIDQYDGQTIHQSGIYGTHVKKSFNLPVDFSHKDAQWHINRIINEGFNLAQDNPMGPVHINVPIRTPFYPLPEEKIVFNKQVRIVEKLHFHHEISMQRLGELADKLGSFNKILVVPGQDNYDENLVEVIDKFCDKYQSPIVTDIISNLQSCHHAIYHQDAFLEAINNEMALTIQPQLLITFGKSIISKHLKLFLRQNPAIEHWHLQAHGEVADTYQSLTTILKMDTLTFFKRLGEGAAENTSNYLNQWKKLDTLFNSFNTSNLIQSEFNEFSAVNEVLNAVPNHSLLHLANSMAVRYANFIGLKQKEVEVFCNRGTSGIDGSVSTALGSALKSDKPVMLITGDMAFFYDRNAFWQQELPENLTIILMNNHAGGIFGLIDGPDKLPELSQFFETSQTLNASALVEEYKLDYQLVNSMQVLKTTLNSDFMDKKGLKILEVETDKKVNKKFYALFKTEMVKLYQKL